MPAPASARRRILRALTVAAVLLTSACAAHWVAGGMLPGPGVLTACAAVLLVVGWLLARRDRSARTVGAVAVVGQLGLHLTFAMAMRPAGMPSMASVLCGNTSAPTPAGVVPMHVAAHQLGLGMAAMMAAHAVGGVLTLLLLRSAESTTQLLAAVLRAALRRLLPPASRAWVVPRVLAAPAPVTGPASTVFLRSAPRRGPPAPVCS